MAFSLTPAAAQEILAAAERSDLAGMAIRIAARPTDDGLDFGMGFDDEAEGDAVGVFEGLTVLVAPSSQRWLDALVLDFVEIEAGQHEFVFMPNQDAIGGGCASAQRGCGGGSCSSCGG